MDVERILDCLPQTQCARCGHAGCRPYAEAIAGGEAINRCPPGGETTIRALAAVLGRPTLPLDPAFGEPPAPATARIREEDCIGCFKCVRACPDDAILGAPGFLHTVIATECTGCGLCLPPCPVDCIELPLLPPDSPPAWSAGRARRRADARVARQQRDAAEESAARATKRQDASARARRAVLVREAVERVRSRRQKAVDEPGREH